MAWFAKIGRNGLLNHDLLCNTDRYIIGGGTMKTLIKLAISLFMLTALPSWAQTVAVITPYLAQPGTQAAIEGFEASASKKGWEVNVIDTAGDVAAVISRIEDSITQNVDAIVIAVDPAQVNVGLQSANEAGIPVVGLDAGSDPLLIANVTSNGYAMAAETSVYIANRIAGAGKVVMFVFDAFPPVQIRGVVADAIFGNFPDIEVIDRVTPDVSDGGIADSRAKMEAILAANPEPGSISAVWAAWDQPALGALQAIEGAGRAGEGIVITGIDANPQARDAIASAGNFEASIAQDFAAMGAAAAEVVAGAPQGIPRHI